jgi:hypothetical protein
MFIVLFLLAKIRHTFFREKSQSSSHQIHKKIVSNFPRFQLELSRIDFSRENLYLPFGTLDFFLCFWRANLEKQCTQSVLLAYQLTIFRQGICVSVWQCFRFKENMTESALKNGIWWDKLIKYIEWIFSVMVFKMIFGQMDEIEGKLCNFSYPKIVAFLFWIKFHIIDIFVKILFKNTW